MVAIEFILEFDLFSHKHKEKCKNEKVNVTYLFKTLWEIDRNHVQDEIVNQINNLNTKYQSIIWHMLTSCVSILL